MRDICLNIGTQCNLNCSYCYLKNKNNTQYDNNFKIKLDTLINSLQSINFNRVLLIGAEILTVPTDIIIYTVNKLFNICNRRIVLVSNGSLINEKLISDLSSIKNKIKFTITLDGPEHIHNKYRGLYSDSFNALSLLQKNDIKVSVQVGITKDIVSDLVTFNDWLSILENRGILYQLKFIYGSNEGSFQLLSNELQKQFAEFVYKSNRCKYVQTLNSSLCYKFGNKCGGLYFDIDGDVYPCNKVYDDVNCFSNIYTDNINKIFYDRYYHFFKKEKTRDCGMCDIQEMCNGGCPAERNNGRAIDCVFKLTLQKLFLKDGVDFIDWFNKNKFLDIIEG